MSGADRRYLAAMFNRSIYTLVCSFLTLGVFAQTPPPADRPMITVNEESTDEPVAPVEDVPQEDGIFNVVEQMPEFPGGTAKLMEFLKRNIRYPQDAVEAGIEGKVFVRFVVDKQGGIRDVTVLRGVPGGPMLDKEALRVVKSMPLWSPGMQNGRKVSTYFNLPIVFKLTGETEKK